MGVLGNLGETLQIPQDFLMIDVAWSPAHFDTSSFRKSDANDFEQPQKLF